MNQPTTDHYAAMAKSRVSANMPVLAAVILALFHGVCAFGLDECEKNPTIKKIELLGGQVLTADGPNGRVYLIALVDKGRYFAYFKDEDLEAIDFSALPESAATSLTVRCVELSDRSLVQLAKTKQLHSVHFSGPPFKQFKITDRGLTHFFQSQSRLFDVILDGMPVSDNLIKELAKLQDLRMLSIHSGGFSDQHAKMLTQSRKLAFLDLSWTSVSDEGLKHLGLLEMLGSLDLSGTSITDVGIARLGKLRQLRRLRISDTKVSENAIRALREKLPDLEITK